MITKKFCPKCKGDNVDMVAGGEIGIWECTDCGFRGSIFPEKPILGTGIDDSSDKRSKVTKK